MTTVANTPKRLGLVAGLGVGAGILYYRALVNAHLKRGLTLQIAMVHADVRLVVELAQAGQRQALAEYLTGYLRQLKGAGAQVATVPAFVPQVCTEELAALTPLPLIGLLDAIVDEIRRRRLKRVGILGGRVTIETALFGHLRDVAEVVPLTQGEFDEMGAIYARIVERESATLAEVDSLRALAHRLLERGAEAILLAGTDLSFVFGPDNTDFPHLDGARVHIERIMQVLTSQAS